MPIVRHTKDGVIKSMQGLNNTVRLNVTKPYEFIKTGPHSGLFIIARDSKILMKNADYYSANSYNYGGKNKHDGDTYIQEIVDFIDQ
jgi:hypothetical protein